MDNMEKLTKVHNKLINKNNNHTTQDATAEIKMIAHSPVNVPAKI